MNEKLKFYCPKCGKLLDGITLDYRLEWLCSKCAEDQSDVLHCECGCKVKAVDLDASIRLKEFPGKEFNTVHFIRYE